MDRETGKQMHVNLVKGHLFCFMKILSQTNARQKEM